MCSTARVAPQLKYRHLIKSNKKPANEINPQKHSHTPKSPYWPVLGKSGASLVICNIASVTQIRGCMHARVPEACAFCLSHTGTRRTASVSNTLFSEETTLLPTSEAPACSRPREPLDPRAAGSSSSPAKTAKPGAFLTTLMIYLQISRILNISP